MKNIESVMSPERDRRAAWAKKIGAHAGLLAVTLTLTTCGSETAYEAGGVAAMSLSSVDIDASTYTYTDMGRDSGTYGEIFDGYIDSYVYPIHITADSFPEEPEVEAVETEEPTEEPPVQEPIEKPEEPKAQGLEQFTAKSLPEVAADRISSEGLPSKIEAQKEIYLHAEKETGVPWQLMAAINYREASLRPELSMLDGSPLTAGTSQDGVKIYNDAKKDAVAAANIFKGNAKRYYGVDITDIENLSEEDIANALLSYNRGAMYLNNPGGPMPVSESPYVYNYMNGEQMKWNRADSFNGSERLNRVQGKADGNLGALVIVTYLVQNT